MLRVDIILTLKATKEYGEDLEDIPSKASER